MYSLCLHQKQLQTLLFPCLKHHSFSICSLCTESPDFAICLCSILFTVMGNIHEISSRTLFLITLLCLLAGHYAIVYCLLAYCSISSFKNVTPIVLQKSVNCVALLNTWLIKVCWHVMLGASIMIMKISFKFNLWLFWTQIMTRKIAIRLDFGCCDTIAIHGPFNSNCHLCICLYSFT